MSRYLVASDEIAKTMNPTDFNHAKIFEMSGKASTEYVIEKKNSFQPYTGLKPGSTTTINYKVPKKNILRLKNLWVEFDVSTVDSTNSCTFNQDSLTLIGNVLCKLNDGSEALEIKGVDTIAQLVSDFYCESKKQLAEDLAEWRQTYALNATPVVLTSASAKTLRFPLLPLFPHMINKLMGDWNDIYFEIGFTEAPNTLKAHTFICASDTVNASYTSSINFNNVKLCFNYDNVHDSRLMITPPNNTLKLLQPQYNWKKIDNADLSSTSNEFIIKLSEITTYNNCQKLVFFYKENLSAYNSAECQKKYSRDAFSILVEEIGGSESVLDLTDSLTRRTYRNSQFLNRYGEFLDTSIMDGTNALGVYYITLGDMFFNHIKIESQHNEVVNRLTSEGAYGRDFKFTIKPASVGPASCDIYIGSMRYDEYLWNGQLQLLKYKKDEFYPSAKNEVNVRY